MARNLNTFLTDDFAAIAPRISGSISVVSSSLIIYLIRRSKTKLSIIYHRIMFGMSVADILGSFGMALTTLPMVKSGYGFGNYDYAGTVLGNIHTCRAQGFIVNFGLWCMMTYNVSLCIYYACAIGFQMKEVDIKRKVEPYLHISAIAIGFIPTFTALCFDSLHNSGAEAWCTVSPVPYGGGQIFHKIIYEIIMIAIALLLLIIIGSFTLILIRVHNIEKHFQTEKSKYGKNLSIQRRSPVVAQNLREAEKSNANSRILFRQALAYILALLTSTSMAFLKQVPYFRNKRLDDRIFLCLLPLQGFFNFLIFVAHKVNNYRRKHPNLSRLTVLKMLFFGTNEVDDEVLFSRISLVSINEDNDMERIYVSNEFEDEEYDLSYGSDNEDGTQGQEQNFNDNGMIEDGFSESKNYVTNTNDGDEEKVEIEPSQDSTHIKGLGQAFSSGSARGGSLVSYDASRSSRVVNSFGPSDGLSLGVSTLNSGEYVNHHLQNDRSFRGGAHSHTNSTSRENRSTTQTTLQHRNQEDLFLDTSGGSVASQNVASSLGSKSWFLDRMGFGNK